MYLAQIDSKQSQAPFYINILSDIINGDTEYKEQVDTAIKEAALISANKKDIYSAERQHYFLITSLLVYYQDELSCINQEINNSVYREIIDLLNKNYCYDC